MKRIKANNNRKNKDFNFFLIISAIFLVAFLFFILFTLREKKIRDLKDLGQKQENLEKEKNFSSSSLITEKNDLNNLSQNQHKEEKDEKNNSLPQKVFLKVPFLSQAPFQKWDALHEDACEEASLIMLKYFKDGFFIISPQIGEKEIQDLIKYETKKGYKKSIFLEELKEIAEKYYQMKNGRIKYDILSEDIKKELAKGNPVIIPVAGKILPNPNFRNGGPDYHMLIIKGYDEKGFITNDPGTRKGENFYYSFKDIENAIHNWNEKNIYDGEKAYLVFD